MIAKLGETSVSSKEAEPISNVVQAVDMMRARDLKIAGRIRDGDERAMKEVYELYAVPLAKFVSAWLSNPHDANDVAQDAMMEVWRRADRFEGRSSLKSWIYTIGRYKAIDRNRRASRVTYSDKVPEQVDMSASQEEMLSTSETDRAVRSAMRRLSESHRRVLYLAFFEDFPYKDIAEIECCPVGTVKTRILHAKKRLRHEMSKTQQF